MGGNGKAPSDVPYSADQMKVRLHKELTKLPFTPAALLIVIGARLKNCAAFMKMAAETATGKAVEITATLDGEALTLKPFFWILQSVYDECRATLQGGETEVRRVITGVQLTAEEARMLVEKFFGELNDLREDGPPVTCYSCSTQFQPHSWNLVRWSDDGPVVVEKDGQPVRLGSFKAIFNGGNAWTKVGICSECRKAAERGGAKDPRTFPSAQVDEFLARQKREQEERERRRQEKRLKDKKVAGIFDRKPGDPPVGTHGGPQRDNGAFGKSQK